MFMEPSIEEEFFASIDFRPTCSNCKTLLCGKVVAFSDHGQTRIFPYRCPVCKKIFTTVRTTTKLPFDGYDGEGSNI